MNYRAEVIHVVGDMDLITGEAPKHLDYQQSVLVTTEHFRGVSERRI